MSASKSAKRPKSLGRKIFDILAGYEIAVICFVLLLLLTFFGTIEQSWLGLYQAIEKYFDIDSFLVIPRNSSDKIIGPPMPGAYWVIVVLSVNMFLGGIIRIRKGWKKAGILVTHFAILFMLISGAVESLGKKEGMMLVFQGEKSDYAQSYHDETIEVFAYDENGDRTAPVVVPSEELGTLKESDTLTVSAEKLPFEMKVTGYLGASEMRMSANAPGAGKVVDGFALNAVERDTTEEMNMAGCYVTISKDGADVQELLLWSANQQPVSFNIDGTRYGMILTKKVWPMPFEVELHKTVGEYYPGTRKPSWFQSDVTKVADGDRTDYEIVMNDPMRHGGFTLFQARWDEPQGRPYSGFAIVKNPSDRWPEYAIYVAATSMGFHFVFMLGLYVLRSSRPSKKSVS